MRAALIGFVLTAALGFPIASHAATLAELHAHLQSLLAQIEVQKTQQATAAASANVGTASCPTLSRNLSRGTRGEDVRQLQQFLISQNLLASDSATGFFGGLTEAAVKQFQCKHLSICSGSPSSNGYAAVGPRTRAKIAEVCTAAAPATSMSSTGAVPIPTATTEGMPQTQPVTTQPVAPTCTPLTPQTQTTSCPTGQTGSVTQTRTSSCPARGTSPTWSAWATTSNTCTLPTAAPTQPPPPPPAPVATVIPAPLPNSFTNLRQAIGLFDIPLESAKNNPGWNLDSSLQAIIAPKPKVFRLGVNSLILNDPNRPNPDQVAKISHIAQVLQNAGITVFGASGDFMPWTTGTTVYNKIPCPGSSIYPQFLDNVEAGWKTQAAALPMITVWEVGNEWNMDAYLSPPQSGPGSCGKTGLTDEEHVKIVADIMYRAHRAIKSVNPAALVLMPAIAPANASGQFDGSLVVVATFLEKLYAEIASRSSSSTNPRDYFDGAVWHPYIGYTEPTVANWVQANKMVHDVLVRHGDGSLPVVLSEFGGVNDAVISRHLVATWLDRTLSLTQQHMPWVTAMTYMRAIDDPSAKAWGPAEAHSGILQDQTTGFRWKHAAVIFCKYTQCGKTVVTEGTIFKVNVAGTNNAYYSNGFAYCHYTLESYARFFGKPLDQAAFDTMPTIPSLDVIANIFENDCAG